MQNWHNLGHIYQAVDSAQNNQTSNKNIYSNTISNIGFDTFSNNSSEDKFSAGNQISKNMVDRLMKDTDNIAKLVELNKYVDELEI